MISSDSTPPVWVLIAKTILFQGPVPRSLSCSLEQAAQVCPVEHRTQKGIAAHALCTRALINWGAIYDHIDGIPCNNARIPMPG